MKAKDFLEKQLITDSMSVVDKYKQNYSRKELCKFAEAYHQAKLKLLNMPDVSSSVCDTCAYLESLVYHDMMWCRDCEQGNHFKQTDG